MATTASTIPQDILDALDHGAELTREQLRRVIEAEAESIGLTFDAAVEQARQRTLPKTATGIGLQVLIPIYLHGLKVEAPADAGRQHMADRPVSEQVPMPEHLIEAIEGEDLTEAQINEIIAFEAEQLGLTIPEAYELFRQQQLPHSPLGTDLRFWIAMVAPLPPHASP